MPSTNISEYITVRGRVGTFPSDVLDVKGGPRVDIVLVRSQTDPRILDWTECRIDLIEEIDGKWFYRFSLE